MMFDSLQEFLAMGGHGRYVWLSYGAALIIVTYNVVSVRIAERRFLQAARDRERRHHAARGVAREPLATGESRSS